MINASFKVRKLKISITVHINPFLFNSHINSIICINESFFPFVFYLDVLNICNAFSIHVYLLSLFILSTVVYVTGDSRKGVEWHSTGPAHSWRGMATASSC